MQETIIQKKSVLHDDINLISVYPQNNCIKVNYIYNTMAIPMGGSLIAKSPYTMWVDEDSPIVQHLLERFQQAIQENKQKIEIFDKHIKTLDKDIDPELLFLLNIFTAVYNKEIGYTNIAKNEQKRKDAYHEESTQKISSLLEHKTTLCAEISVVAKLFLQSQNIETYYIDGSYIEDREK